MSTKNAFVSFQWFFYTSFDETNIELLSVNDSLQLSKVRREKSASADIKTQCISLSKAEVCHLLDFFQNSQELRHWLRE